LFNLLFYLTYSIFNSVTSQLAIPNKKTRFGPKAASRDWWIERIKIRKPEIRYWTHYTKYQIAQFKALAELDYQVLGEKVKTEGAPDSDLVGRNYPPKLTEKPFWFTSDYKTFKDFRLWTWLQATKTLDLPIDEKAETWFNYFSIENNQVKAKELLDPFRKENKKQFDILLQQEYDSVYPTARCICSIHYAVPDQDPFEDLEINTHLQDSRLIPVTQAGDTISRDFLKHYLEERLGEYLALGGLKELLDRRALILAEQKLPAPFYWDLWGNLKHLRETYEQWLGEHIFDVPNSDEEQEVESDSDISWDTQ
jgi:hypothetical protein